MRLRELFKYLGSGELKHTFVNMFDTTEVDPVHYKELVQHVNLGIQQLYTRFPLLEKEYIVNLEYGVSTYTLPSDLLRVNVIYDYTGRQLPVNDENASNSVFLPSTYTLQVPWADGTDISVIYRAIPEDLVIDEDDLDTSLDQEISVPPYMNEALFSYIEYRVRKSQGGESAIQLSQVAKQLFEASCNEIEKRNLTNNGDISTCVLPELRGFV